MRPYASPLLIATLFDASKHCATKSNKHKEYYSPNPTHDPCNGQCPQDIYLSEPCGPKRVYCRKGSLQCASTPETLIASFRRYTLLHKAAIGSTSMYAVFEAINTTSIITCIFLSSHAVRLLRQQFIVPPELPQPAKLHCILAHDAALTMQPPPTPSLRLSRNGSSCMHAL